MEECESQLSPTVYDVEEGEISDSASSVEEISEEVFNKKEQSPVAVADAPAAPPPPPPPKPINVNSPNANNSSNNYHNSTNNHNSNQKPRVWTMRDLYKYQLSRNYSAGLYNLAWASAVQNKPLDEILVMELPDASSDNNGSNSNLKRGGSDNSNNSNNNNASNNSVSSSFIGESKEGVSAASPNEKQLEEKEEGELEEGEIDMDSEMVETDRVVSQENDFRDVWDKEANLDKQLDFIRKGFESVSVEEAEK